MPIFDKLPYSLRSQGDKLEKLLEVKDSIVLVNSTITEKMC